jgi:hypothetical protein
MVWYTLEMVCKGNGNGMHWQLYAFAMVCIALPLYGMHWYGMVWYGVVWYGIPYHCLVSYGIPFVLCMV